MQVLFPWNDHILLDLGEAVLMNACKKKAPHINPDSNDNKSSDLYFYFIMLGTFQHWKLCYALLDLDRFICWLKTTKLPRKLTFLSYFLFRIGTLQMQMDFSLSWHKKCTKIHLRLSNTPSSPNLLSKNTKISFNHTRWIQIILSFPPQGITGNMAKTASWKSKNSIRRVTQLLGCGQTRKRCWP